MQQQPAAADALQIQAGVQLPARLQPRALAAAVEVDLPTLQQLGKHLGAAPPAALRQPAANRQHQIGRPPAGLGCHPAEAGIAQADRRIGGPQVQVQAALVGEAGIGCHHHVGVGIGLGQAHRGHQGAPIGGQPHPQPAAPLPFA
jgi:hypothetical protein